MKFVLLGALAVAATSAFAQTSKIKYTGKIKQATPIAFAKISRDGKLMEAWKPYHAKETGRTATTLNIVQNGTNTSVAAALGGGFDDDAFGADNGNWYWGPITIPMWAEDCKPAAGTGSTYIDFVQFLFDWSDPSLAVEAVFYVDKVGSNSAGPAFNIGYGYAFLFDFSAGGGIFYTNIDLTGTDSSWPAPPATGGGFLWQSFSTDGTNLFAASALSESQLLTKNPLGVASVPAGTNPSYSDRFNWVDGLDSTYNYNGPDYVFQTSADAYDEYVDEGDTNFLFDQAGTLSGWQDPDARTIEGNATFEGYSGPRSAPSAFIVTVSDGTNTFDNVCLNDGSSGTVHYKVKDVNQAGAGGTRTVHIKAESWLGHTVNANTTGGDVTGVNISCKNGDVDGDDVVSVFDYIVMSDNFDKDETAPDWNDPQGGSGTPPINWADLDRDGVISIFDYIQLSDNFDLAGD